MSTKSERRAAREAVAAYHEAQLVALVQRVGEAVDSFRAGETDAFETDQLIFQYSRAAKELWTATSATSSTPRTLLVRVRRRTGGNAVHRTADEATAELPARPYPRRSGFDAGP